MKMTGGDEVKAALRPRSGCANELTKEGLPGLAGRPETGNQTHPRARWRHRLARTLVVIPVMVLGLLNSVPRLTAQTDQEAPTVRYPLPTLLDVQPGLEV